MVSPIFYFGGAVLVIGGLVFVIRKVATSGTPSTCYTTEKLAALIADVKIGVVSVAVALEIANKLEKDGCAAADVAWLRKAAKDRSEADAKATADAKTKCPSPAELAETIAKAGTLTFEDVARIAAEWDGNGCKTEAKSLKDAFAAALKKVAEPWGKKFKGTIDKPGDKSTEPEPDPGVVTSALEGWPAVKELPSEVYAKVYPHIRNISWTQLWRLPDATTEYLPTLAEICKGDPAIGYVGCSSADLIRAWKAVQEHPLGGLGGLTEPVRDAAVEELKKAAARLYEKEPHTAGFTRRQHPFARGAR